MNNYLIKANQNEIIGDYSEKNDYYDVAVSRYYYCLYEKAIYIAKKEGFYNHPKGDTGQHNSFINDFIQNVEIKLDNKEISKLMNFSKLKNARVKADYYEETSFKNKNDYNLGFKIYFKYINTILDKLIN